MTHEADLYIYNPTNRIIEISDITIKLDPNINYSCISIKVKLEIL